MSEENDQRSRGSSMPPWPGSPGDPAVSPASSPDAPGAHPDAIPSAAEVREAFESEAPTRRLRGAPRALSMVGGVAISVYALYWVVGIVDPLVYRVSFLLLALLTTFLLYPGSPRDRDRVPLIDWLLMALTVASLGWPLVDLAELPYRSAVPSAMDLLFGCITIALVLEATRRTAGWILPVTAIGFIAYAYYGPLLEVIGLDLFAHRGYQLDRMVGMLYMTLEGIFGVPLDVAATYIVLFTIFGAVLEQSGAGRFFIDWAMSALGRSRSAAAPARAVTAAGFLLGTVSGSGVATTVTLGSVSWPLLRRAGYSPEVGGAILAASGIGAILSPPTLGAAAFLIAEFLGIRYLQILIMATLPTVLYYLSAFVMIESDARRSAMRPVEIAVEPLWKLTRRGGYHFISLVAIAALMASGMSAFRAVFWATLLAFALSYVRRETALGPKRVVRALESGGVGVLSVAATTATAGIIVGVVTLTGLGLKMATILVTLSGGHVFMTTLYAALAVWILGLAVPVTASYIIAAVIIAPALTQVGIPAVAAHMFIFYYAVLSEVSPPTALSPFAAAAITGANPFRTMMITWKYTLPAFVVPFAFTLSPEGLAILMQASPGNIAVTAITSSLGVVALAIGFGGWLYGSLSLVLRALFATAGIAFLRSTPSAAAVGALLLLVGIAVQKRAAGREKT
ncbi:MAG TPA: TRAP transporter fused permease subunit [Thermoanaerobaculia bacterium]|nr:TRAP transporter fused permease subunit [Thermoanaerobaculia bacterium]